MIVLSAPKRIRKQGSDAISGSTSRTMKNQFAGAAASKLIASWSDGSNELLSDAGVGE